MTNLDKLPLRRRAELLRLRAQFHAPPGLAGMVQRLHEALLADDDDELLDAYRLLAGVLRLPSKKEWAAVTDWPYPGNWQQLRRLWNRLGLPGDVPLPCDAAADILDKLKADSKTKTDDGKRLLLSEISRMFGMKPRAVKGFCKRHDVPTKQEPRRFWIALVPFATAYAQDTNVRTNEALLNRVAAALNLHEITSKLDAVTAQFFGQ